MTLPELSIRRPVLATVMSLALVLIGLVSYQRLAVREYPKIDEPQVTVETTYRGASADIIESRVTTPLEDSISGIEGVELIQSFSRAEKSQVTVRFNISRNIDDAASDVRDRVSRVRAQLPTEVDEPVIAKVEADAFPIVYLSFTSPTLTAVEVTDVIDRVVKDRLQTIDGVSAIRIFGERRYAMRIWLDKARLAAYRLTVQEVEAALRRQNVEIPSGRIESADREFTVVSETDLRTSAQFNEMILRENDGYLVRLKDVGRAELDAQDVRVIARVSFAPKDGRPAVIGASSVNVGLIRTSTANPLAIVEEARRRLAQLETELAPLGVRGDITYDTTVFIERSITNVFRTIAEAVILVVLVIFLFLRSVRATLIPLVTIPVSLIGAFALMLLFGFSINTLSLLAMVLAIGLVVDDAIVVLENISRHIEDGMKPLDAALQGSREIAFAVMAMTATLAAVYAPMAFQTGRTGKLFTEFALTLAGAVVVSGFVALTLTPMMCAKMLHHNPKPGRLYLAGERVLDAMSEGYSALLRAAMRARAVVLLLCAGVAVFGGWLFTKLPSELSPIEDRGIVMNILVGPEGATPEYTLRYAQMMEQIYMGEDPQTGKRRFPHVERVLVIVGFPDVTRGLAFVRLKPWEERDVKQQEYTNKARPLAMQIPGTLAFPINPPSLGARAIDKPVQFVLQTSRPFQELDAVSAQFLELARTHPRLSTGLTNIESDLKLNKPEIKVNIDREKAANLGVEIDTIGRTLETMLGGRQVTRFKKDGKQYDVIVQIEGSERSRPQHLSEIYVRARSGQMVSLASLVSHVERVAPRELNHFNKLRAAIISGNLNPGYALGDALADMREIAKQLPSHVSIDYAGVSREFTQSSRGLYEVFAMALLFIFLVLAAQFESFADPLIIMLTVPITMTGALLALWLTGNTLNVYSQIGLVTLVGLITKHGILIVEFANQLQETGKSKVEAVQQAAVLRLRPILMTTGAMVLGAIPLAMSTGAGGESRQAIGWVIVGGMTLGTLLTLFVVPAAYSYLARSSRASLHVDDAKVPPPAPASPHPAE
ncbi:MAG: multidrug transporter AcrB [Alphaproteobacteria bacterium RIFCSPHIGHO2_12_FULL_66_14]|nr:MAG: multidrug transporter AcrB [Alphaproteobacteria bacterium RIFCSPHIGHO2_12_FULL_66_14]